jgi:sec-independent protein translocase protein TatC
MGTTKKNDLLNSTMSLGDHLEELRMRLLFAIAGLVIAAVICLFFGPKIITFLQSPYNRLMPEHPLTALAPADAFIGYMKVSLISGLVIASPWVFYQIWMFVAAGLYPHEKRYVRIAAPFCAGLFVAGALFFVFAIAPLSLAFFLKFGRFINIAPNWTFASYISFMTILMLVFGIAFQTPIAIFFLNRTGLVSIRSLRNARKFVLLAVFIVAAIATPPDVISQIALAIPLYALFELGIILSYIANRKKKPQHNQ